MKPDHILVGEIDDETAKAAISDLLSLKTKQTINIFMASQGGDVEAALAIAGAMSALQREGKKISIHVGGVAHSSAALLLQFADERIIEPYTTVRLHQITGDYAEQKLSHTDVIGEMQQFDSLHEIYYDVLARRTGIPFDTWIKKLRENEMEWLLDANEIIKHGLADRILDYVFPVATKKTTPRRVRRNANVIDIGSRKDANTPSTDSTEFNPSETA